MTLVLQLGGWPRAFAEVHSRARSRQAGSRSRPSTTPTSRATSSGGYFPSFEARDKERFPSADELEEELGPPVSRHVRSTRLTQHETVDRETVLERIRGKHISTFQLISDEEYAAGLEARRDAEWTWSRSARASPQARRRCEVRCAGADTSATGQRQVVARPPQYTRSGRRIAREHVGSVW